MGQKPAWIVAALLLMIAFLMTSHVGLLLFSMWECHEYAEILFDQARRLAEEQDEQVVIKAVNSECSAVEEVFADAVAQYLAVILALLTGAGLAARGAIDRTRAVPPDATAGAAAPQFSSPNALNQKTEPRGG